MLLGAPDTSVLTVLIVLTGLNVSAVVARLTGIIGVTVLSRIVVAADPNNMI